MVEFREMTIVHFDEVLALMCQTPGIFDAESGAILLPASGKSHNISEFSVKELAATCVACVIAQNREKP